MTADRPRTTPARAKTRPADTSETSSVLDKAFAVLTSFGSQDFELSLLEISARSGLAKPSAYRALAALEKWGAVERTGRGRYRLGLRLLELGALVHTQVRIRTLALPVLQQLHESTGETVHLTTLRGTRVLYLEKIRGHRPVPGPSMVGGTLPAHCTANGKALLAFGDPAVVRECLSGKLERRTPNTLTDPAQLVQELARVRKSGFASEREETVLELGCVAAPILASSGRAMAALSISGPIFRMQPDRNSRLVKEAAVRVSKEVQKEQMLGLFQ